MSTVATAYSPDLPTYHYLISKTVPTLRLHWTRNWDDALTLANREATTYGIRQRVYRRGRAWHWADIK